MNDLSGGERARPGSWLGAAPQGSGFGRRAAASPALHPAPRAAESAPAPGHRPAPAPAPDLAFAIGGHDIQHVEIALEPGEAVVAENGAMIWKDADVDHSLVLGDGRDDAAGFGSRLANAGANLLAGETLWLSQFRHAGGPGPARIALGGKLPGSIIAVRLADVAGALVCHRGAFLAGAKGVAVSAGLQRNLASGLLGSEGLVTQTLTGTGWVFLHVGGALVERVLERGQMIHVDSGCVVAHEASVDLSVALAGGLGASLGGGEELLLASVRGPGRVWIQTLPFQRIADAVTRTGTPSVGSAIAGGIGGGIGAGVGHVVKDSGIEMLKKLF
jgi:uncharacterized protein (AIM24 family)